VGCPQFGDCFVADQSQDGCTDAFFFEWGVRQSRSEVRGLASRVSSPIHTKGTQGMSKRSVPGVLDILGWREDQGDCAVEQFCSFGLVCRGSEVRCGDQILRAITRGDARVAATLNELAQCCLLIALWERSCQDRVGYGARG